MHVPLGHREIGVPGQFLNGTDGGTPHRQMGTKRVAQDVHAEVRQACATCHTSDPTLYHLPREWTPVPTKNLIRTVCVTDRAVLGRRTITSVGMADVRSVEVDGRLASFGRSSGRRVSVHGLQAPAIRGCGQAACRW